MSKYRHQLPQLGSDLFLTDGGLETTLVFHEGFDLPYFAAFPLLRDERGRSALRRYFQRYARIAVQRGMGFVLESPTWRASSDWGDKLGDSRSELRAANEASIALLVEVRREFESESCRMPISGCVGPRGDGYVPGAAMTEGEARDYHAEQIRTFERTPADLVTAITMTNAAEATGVVRAAVEVELPVVISFTLETDGKLPTGQPLAEAIAEVDAATRAAPLYYMLNCAHPTHFEQVLVDAAWARRLRGIRANASRRSHSELDQATDLDDGDPQALGAEYAALRRRFPWLNILGGCCGTDHRHIEHISEACGVTSESRLRVDATPTPRIA